MLSLLYYTFYGTYTNFVTICYSISTINLLFVQVLIFSIEITQTIIKIEHNRSET